MTTANQEILDLVNQAAEYEDQTQVKESTDFEYTPPAEGITVGRLIEYIELGFQPQKPFKGKPKQPAEMIRITFELLSPNKNIREIELDGKKVKVADKVSLTIKKSFDTRASFFKLFDKMRYGRQEIKHMAQCLGEAFIITVLHNTVEKDGKKFTYVNLNNKAGEYLIQAPFKVDPLTEEKQPLPIPQALSPIRIFLFGNPTQATWDSLFIDGEKTIKDGDEERIVSKNWLQQKIMDATNFVGSPLEAMIEGSDKLPTIEELEDAPTDDSVADLGLEETVEEPVVEKKSVATVGKKPAASSASTASVKEAAKPAPTVAAKASTAKASAPASNATKSPSKPAATVAKAAVAKPAAKKAVAPTEDPLAALGLIG